MHANRRFSAARVVALLFGCAALSGCGTAPVPTLVPAEGVVTINGQPLPNASVTLTPTTTFRDNAGIALGTTDAQGRFTLSTDDKPGAALGEHKITISDGPVPSNLRDETKQNELRAFLASQKNRPIPAMYSSPSQSPLKILVKVEQTSYPIELKR